MCFSRREWLKELARREREEQELRELLDREAERRAPTFIGDADTEVEERDREPVGVER